MHYKLAFRLLPLSFCLAFTCAAESQPAWSAGRDGSGRLMVDAGPIGTVTFESEVVGAAPREVECTGTPCDRVAYDWTRDGYGGRPLGSCLTRGECAAEDDDLAHPVWKDGAYRHVLIRNWSIKNAFKTSSAPHVDVTQILDSPGWGGWFVMQDSILENSDDGIVQWQFGYQESSRPAYEGRTQREFGGVVIQNLTLGQAQGFISDCTARNSINGTDSVCNQGNYMGNYNGAVPAWLINYHTNGWTITLQQEWQKVVVVGTLPKLAFRADGGSLAFRTQQTCSTATSDACSYSGRVFGPYPSIEAAIADGHSEPPFVRLSCSGWANSGNCSGGVRPEPPQQVEAR